MGYQLFDAGEELRQKHFYTDEANRPSSLQMLVYDDATDALTDTDDDPDVDITTEATGAAYGRQNVAFTADFTVSQVSGDWIADYADQTFGLQDDSDGSTDSWATVANVALAGDGGTPADHLFLNGSLSQSYSMSSTNSLTVQDAGDSLT